MSEEQKVTLFLNQIHYELDVIIPKVEKLRKIHRSKEPIPQSYMIRTEEERVYVKN